MFIYGMGFYYEFGEEGPNYLLNPSIVFRVQGGTFRLLFSLKARGPHS